MQNERIVPHQIYMHRHEASKVKSISIYGRRYSPHVKPKDPNGYVEPLMTMIGRVDLPMDSILETCDSYKKEGTAKSLLWDVIFEFSEDEIRHTEEGGVDVIVGHDRIRMHGNKETIHKLAVALGEGDIILSPKTPENGEAVVRIKMQDKESVCTIPKDKADFLFEFIKNMASKK